MRQISAELAFKGKKQRWLHLLNVAWGTVRMIYLRTV